jgi:hypothetical protein
MAEPREAVASCMCGAVRLRARFPSLFCCHCHCDSCRRSHGAAYVTWIGFPAAQVEVIAGADRLRSYESSPGTLRKFCATCGTKVSFESQRWSGEIHLPLALIRTPVDRAPQRNVFVEERVAWAPLPALQHD